MYIWIKRTLCNKGVGKYLLNYHSVFSIKNALNFTLKVIKDWHDLSGSGIFIQISFFLIWIDFLACSERRERGQH